VAFSSPLNNLMHH